MSHHSGVPPRPEAYRWLVVGLLLAFREVSFMAMAALGILLPSISDDLELSSAQQGVLASSVAWGSVVLAIPLGLWAARLAPKMLTTVTLLLSAALLAVQGSATAFIVLLMGRLGFGLVMLAREPARAILVRQWTPVREMILVSSVSNVLFGVLVGGGLLIIPHLLNVPGLGWRQLFFIFAALFVCFAALWTIFGREARRDQRTSELDYSLFLGSLRYRDVWVAGLGFVGAQFAWSSFVSFFPTLMLETYEVSLGWSGAILGASIMVGGVSGLGAGYAVTVLRQRRWVLFGLGVLMVITYLGMTLAGAPVLALACAVINGIAWGFWPVLHSVPYVVRGIRDREVPVALALMMTMTGAGALLGPIVSGALQETWGTLRPVLTIVSFAPMSLCAAGLLLRQQGNELP